MTDAEHVALARRIMDRIESDKAVHLSSIIEESKAAEALRSMDLKPPFVLASAYLAANAYLEANTPKDWGLE